MQDGGIKRMDSELYVVGQLVCLMYGGISGQGMNE